MAKSGLRKLRMIREHLNALHHDDFGQDLIEYAFVAALIALSAVIGMGSVAKAVNDIFSSVGEKIRTYI
jgi:Flp pilus assembly pilin Flp